MKSMIYPYLYFLISLILFYWIYHYLMSDLTSDTHKETFNIDIPIYSRDADWIPAKDGYEIKPVQKKLELSQPIYPQLIGMYMSEKGVNKTYWRIDERQDLRTVYTFYGKLIEISAKQRVVNNGYLKMNFKRTDDTITTAWFNGSRMIIEEKEPWIIQRIDYVPLPLSTVVDTSPTTTSMETIIEPSKTVPPPANYS